MPESDVRPGLSVSLKLVQFAAAEPLVGTVSAIVHEIRRDMEAHAPGLDRAIQILAEALATELFPMPKRYTLGPALAQRHYAGSPAPPAPVPPPAPAPALPDVAVVLGNITDSDVEVTIPAYDPAAMNAPTEIRLYLAPVGATLPADAAGWVGSSFPVASFAVPTPAPGPVGINLYKVPAPAVAAGDYLGQVVLGFPA